MKYIICSRCKSKRQLRHTRYKELLSQYSSKESLKSHYVCSQCKAFKKIKPTVIDTKQKGIDELLSELTESQIIQTKVQNIANWLHEKGIHDRYNRDMFYKTLKTMLSDHMVSDFTINISENRIHSVVLSKLPVIGKHTIGVK